MSGNDCLGAFYETPQKPNGFSPLWGAPASPDLKIHSPAQPRRAQTRTHFIRSIAPRVLIPPPITLVSVLSGILTAPHRPEPRRGSLRSLSCTKGAAITFSHAKLKLLACFPESSRLHLRPEPRRELISFVLLHQGCLYHLQSRW